MREPTISIHFVRAVLHYCQPPNDVRELLTQNRIPAQLLAQNEARVAAEDYANLVRDTMLFLGDETLGYGIARQPLGSWEMMCQSAISATTLGEALRRLARFYRLIDWGFAPRLLRDGDTTRLLLESPSHAPSLPPYIHESFLFYVHRFASWLMAELIPAPTVEFSFDEPVYAAEYRYMFPGCTVRHRQPVSAISFAPYYLQRPLRQTPETLREFLQHPNHAMIAQQFDQHSWHYRVRSLLARELAQRPSCDCVARALGTHPQTLRRHLRREGHHYREIKDRVRRDTAIYLLSNRRESVEETAALTGFAEASSFIRSFRKWTGVTPYTYRRGA